MKKAKKEQKGKAEKLFEKADELFEALLYKKAARYYYLAGDNEDFNMAEESYLKAAHSFIQKDKHLKVIQSLRKSANSSLQLGNTENAKSLYEKALEYVNNLREGEDKEYNYILFSSLSYICSFVKGESDKGLILVKKIQKKVNKDYFKENPLIHLVTNLTIAIREKKKNFIEKIISEFNKIKLKEVEKKLVKISLLLGKIQVSITPEINLDKDKYTTKEIVKMTLEISNDSISEILKDPFFEHEINEIEILNFKIDVTENFSSQTKPNLPLRFDLQQKFHQEFIFKPQFLLDKCLIGPVKIKCKLNKKYICYFEDRSTYNINLVAPPTFLEISVKNLKPPLIEQTFPFEILIENKSDGEASDLSIDVKFPEGIKVIRGTIQKQIYSLRSNENIRWEINAKPLEAGDFEIEIHLKFKDPDQNIIEEKKNFPLAIKL